MQKGFVVKVVVDTDIIIDFLRTGKGILFTLITLQANKKIELYFSSITLVELFSGKSAKNKDNLLAQLLSYFIVVPFDGLLARFAGEKRRKLKRTLPIADLVIGATALYLNAALATRNKKHYRGLKIKFFITKPDVS